MSDMLPAAALDADEQHALAAWLAPRLHTDGEVRIDGTSRPSSGFSAETTIVSVHYDRDGGEARAERIVLRREVPDPAVYPVQVPGFDVEVEIQYRAMAAVAATGAVPIAPLLGYESNPAVLGAPFFVMGCVDGDVPTENPPYPLAGFFAAAAPDERARLLRNGMRTVAALHAIDWRAVGLDFLVAPRTTPGTARQLALWTEYAERELDGRRHPGLARAGAWLHAHLPAEERVGLCWGDPRPGNIIWRDFAPACVTDFEAACIGAPAQDVGWWLMFDRTMHPDGTRADGDVARDQQLAWYADAAGCDLDAVGDLVFHELFAAYRYAAIVVRVMNRLVARGDLPADQTIWLENPAATVLDELVRTAA